MGEAARHLNGGGVTEEREETPPVCNKYLYPEFAGWSGERYLKKLLRQILPMALYRTWEIFVDHQALGNDCYLGVTHLAELAGRATRTMEKNLASLCAKHLLAERAERKVFCRSDGKRQSRVVIVKDFSGLYALAHEYHEWVHAETYITPEREMMALVKQEPHLVAKIRRFENYRRLLQNRLPGPAIQQREEDRWFTEYQPEPVKGALGFKKDVIAAKTPAKDLPKEVAESSQKRRIVSALFNRSTREVIDSAVPSFQENETHDAGSTQLKSLDRCASAEAQEHASLHPLLPGASLAMQEPSTAQRSWTQENTISFAQEDVLEQATASAFPHLLQHACREEAEPEAHTLASPLLADAFLTAIAHPFGDRNPQGTSTRVRTLLSEADVDQPTEVVMVLIRAYVVARDTRAIRPEHCHPETGQVNRMPLFCAMVQRFAEASRRESRWDSSWQHIEEEIAADDRLAGWWKQYHFLPGERHAQAQECEQKQSDALLEDDASEAYRWSKDSPQCQTRRLRSNQRKRASTNAPERAGGSPTSSARSAHEPDDYETYINALMTKYNAPEALQEAR